MIIKLPLKFILFYGIIKELRFEHLHKSFYRRHNDAIFNNA